MTDKEVVELFREMSNDSARFTKEERSALLCGISAVEKQISKHPYYVGDGYDDKDELIYDTGYCPCCQQDYEIDYDTPKYCKKCGQALDWG